MSELMKDLSQYRKTARPEKLTRLLEIMKLLADEKFTGYIKVNFSQGGIGRIEKFEEILREEIAR
ncbi:MAG TPA: hypothetical protein VKF36_06550 [Syntrophorhabdales bacterium]|nr:hypothetical protein [Syntrophorhabdales bacterium]